VTKAGESAVPVSVSLLSDPRTPVGIVSVCSTTSFVQKGVCRRLAGASLVSVQTLWRVVTILEDGPPPYGRCERLINPPRTVGVRETPQYGVCILEVTTSVYSTSTPKNARHHAHTRENQSTCPLSSDIAELCGYRPCDATDCLGPPDAPNTRCECALAEWRNSRSACRTFQ